MFLCSLQRSSPGQAPGARGPRAQGPRRRQEEAAGAGGGSRRRQQEEKAAPGEGAAADTALGTGTALGPLPAVSNTACPRLVLTSKSIFIDKRSRPLVRRLQRDTDESRSPLAAAANTKSNTLPLRAAEKKPSSAALPERPLHLHIAQTRWVTHACLGGRSMAPPLQPSGAGTAQRPPNTPLLPGGHRLQHTPHSPEQRGTNPAQPSLALHGEGTDTTTRSSPSCSQHCLCRGSQSLPTPGTSRAELLRPRAGAVTAWQEEEPGSAGAGQAPEGAGRERGRDIFIPRELSEQRAGALAPGADGTERGAGEVN